jgi:uncharacterized protein (TIGR00251 family)
VDEARNPARCGLDGRGPRPAQRRSGGLAHLGSAIVAPTADLRVRLTPRAAREAVTLREDGGLAVRVTAPPVDGRANAALERAVAKALGVPRSTVSVVRGARSREKTVRIEGLDADGLRERLGRL